MERAKTWKKKGIADCDAKRNPRVKCKQCQEKKRIVNSNVPTLLSRFMCHKCTMMKRDKRVSTFELTVTGKGREPR